MTLRVFSSAACQVASSFSSSGLSERQIHAHIRPGIVNDSPILPFSQYSQDQSFIAGVSCGSRCVYVLFPNYATEKQC